MSVRIIIIDAEDKVECGRGSGELDELRCLDKAWSVVIPRDQERYDYMPRSVHDG